MEPGTDTGVEADSKTEEAEEEAVKRVIDALVADAVFGLKVEHNLGDKKPRFTLQADGMPPARYTEDMEAAYAVVAEMIDNHGALCFDVQTTIPNSDPVEFVVRFMPDRWDGADNLPEAICRAALRALGVKVPGESA